MKNKLSDLNNHLFAQLERLGDEELTGEALIEEQNRAKSLVGVASQIIANSALVLKAAEFAAQHLDNPPKRLPPMWDD